MSKREIFFLLCYFGGWAGWFAGALFATAAMMGEAEIRPKEELRSEEFWVLVFFIAITIGFCIGAMAGFTAALTSGAAKKN